MIGQTAKRFVAIDDAKRVKVVLTNITESDTIVTPFHNKNPKLGEKVVYTGPVVWIEGDDAATLSVGQEVRRCQAQRGVVAPWFSQRARVCRATPGCAHEVEHVRRRGHQQGRRRCHHQHLRQVCAGWKLQEEREAHVDLRLGTVAWRVVGHVLLLTCHAVLGLQPNLVKFKAMEYDFLITKANLEKDDSIEDFINPVTSAEVRRMLAWVHTMRALTLPALGVFGAPHSLCSLASRAWPTCSRARCCSWSAVASSASTRCIAVPTSR